MQCRNRPIKELLKLLPPGIIKFKPSTLSKRLVSCMHTGIQQKFADTFMASPCCLLQQLLDRQIRTDIDPFSFERRLSSHFSSN